MLKEVIWSVFACLTLILSTYCNASPNYFDDICGSIHGKHIYLDYGESGTLVANYANNLNKSHFNVSSQKKCKTEFTTCPFCILQFKFRSLNISRNCNQLTVFDSCGCDYVWIYEPAFEQRSGEQFCGRFIKNNNSDLDYVSKTRKIAIVFLYSLKYDGAFTLDYYTERNRFVHRGTPTIENENNASQVISSPFFPNFYPADLDMEHEIVCECNETCRISFVFTDYLISSSSLLEFYDSNKERIFVTTNNMFRPPILVTSGPSLTLRFYANGASSFGFRATYSYILGNAPTTVQLKPNIDCGGYVNNLGGGITMMNMVKNGTKSFDCIWLIKPPSNYYHMKTHLYVRVISFEKLVRGTELQIRHGLTSDGPVVEHLRQSPSYAYQSHQKEHVVPITQGFYVSLKGTFEPASKLTIVYAAFNYKDCLAGSDFLCQNMRCISILLNCDGFDHCGDQSDEFSINCSRDPKDRRKWSQTPNFFFPKNEAFSNLSTIVLLLASFGLMGFVFSVVVVVYRLRMRKLHRRSLQDHIDTIHAILEEGISEVEEVIIIPDDPPDYEAPPDYRDVVKIKQLSCKVKEIALCKQCNLLQTLQSCEGQDGNHVGSSTIQTTSSTVPESPPPIYKSNISVVVCSTNQPSTTFSYLDKKSFPKLERKLSTDSNNKHSADFGVSYFSDSELHCTVRKMEKFQNSDACFYRRHSIDDLYLF